MSDRGKDRGSALIVALFALAFLTALGLALVLDANTETLIAASFRDGQEALYAADGAAERAMADLAATPDWNAVLAGGVLSGFVDGTPGGPRTLPDGSRIDLTQATNTLNCGRAAGCTVGDMNAVTAQRPWGANNPRWTLYAYGALNGLDTASAVESNDYVVVWVADDQSETDDDPTADGNDATNPGSGLLALHVEAFGSQGAHRIEELTIRRLPPPEVPAGSIEVVSWRTVR